MEPRTRPAHEYIEATMRRIEAQPILFAERPARLGLHGLRLGIEASDTITVRVWRNHAIEPILELARPYCDFGRWRAEFSLSPYDDSLNFADAIPADLELLWLDSDRYLAQSRFEDWLAWLAGRLQARRAATRAPLLVATWLDAVEAAARLQAVTDALPGVYWANMATTCRETGMSLTDPRSAAVAGTPISRSAQPLLARELACHWLPAAVFPPLKAVVLDLDNTLHAGVLGEDGPEGVSLTPAHRELQEFIKSLRERGIFIALLSRNERIDVENLFARREDYPLRWQDFSATEISWNSKAEGMVRLAERLRIAPDAMLFVDDNPGELAEMAERLPRVPMVHASAAPELTRRAIAYYPGTWRWRLEADDGKRFADLRANAERTVLLSELADPGEYLRSLQVTLSYRIDPTDQLSRLADLCQKTNQFNLSLRRFNPADLAERMARTDAAIASVVLRDRLSDSGIVAVIVAERGNENLYIEELCISCRALGRHLEDSMILWAIRSMPLFDGCREVVFRVRNGPRNQPALSWLHRLPVLAAAEAGLVSLSADWLAAFEPTKGITIT